MWVESSVQFYLGGYEKVTNILECYKLIKVMKRMVETLLKQFALIFNWTNFLNLYLSKIYKVFFFINWALYLIYPIDNITIKLQTLLHLASSFKFLSDFI